LKDCSRPQEVMYAKQVSDDISETIQGRGMVTTGCYQEVISGSSNGAISDDLQWPSSFSPTANLFRCNFLWMIYLAVSATAVSCPLIIHVDISLLQSITAQTFYGPFPGPPGWAGARENLGTLWCKGRLTEADTQTIRLGATPSRLSSAHRHHPPFFTGRMPFLPPNQQYQSTEGN